MFEPIPQVPIALGILGLLIVLLAEGLRYKRLCLQSLEDDKPQFPDAQLVLGLKLPGDHAVDFADLKAVLLLLCPELAFPFPFSIKWTENRYLLLIFSPSENPDIHWLTSKSDLVLKLLTAISNEKFDPLVLDKGVTAIKMNENPFGYWEAVTSGLLSHRFESGRNGQLDWYFEPIRVNYKGVDLANCLFPKDETFIKNVAILLYFLGNVTEFKDKVQIRGEALDTAIAWEVLSMAILTPPTDNH